MTGIQKNTAASALTISLTFLLLMFGCLISCKQKLQSDIKTESKTQNESSVINKDTLGELKIELFKDEKLGWGYDIYRKGEKFIHQPHIPAISGIKGFESERDALLVAQLVTSKIRNNIIPPGVSLEELDSLKITINHKN